MIIVSALLVLATPSYAAQDSSPCGSAFAVSKVVKRIADLPPEIRDDLLARAKDVVDPDRIFSPAIRPIRGAGACPGPGSHSRRSSGTSGSYRSSSAVPIDASRSDMFATGGPRPIGRGQAIFWRRSLCGDRRSTEWSDVAWPAGRLTAE